MSDMRKEAVDRVVAFYGSWRAAGEAIGVDHSYLWRIAHYQKNPSEAICKKLNLRREVHWEWRK